MALELKEIPGGFTVSLNGRLVLQHQPRRPLLWGGTGEDCSESHSGFFKIRERSVKLNPLAGFSIESVEPDKITLNFEDQAVLTVTLASAVGNGTAGAGNHGGGDEVILEPRILNPQWNRLKIFFEAPAEEEIYGGGEIFRRANLNGRKLPLWLSEPGVGRRFDLMTLGFALRTKHIPRWFNSYITIPVWLSSTGFYGLSSSSAYTVLDFTDKSRHGVYLWGKPEKITLGFAPDLPGAVTRISSLLGRQPAPPDWVHDGFILGVQGGKDIVSGHIDKVTGAGVPLAAVWCQDWEGIRKTSFGKQLRWAWEFDPRLYPDLPRFIETLKERGVRYLGYNNTFLTPGSDMFDTAREKGYLIKRENGEPYFVDVPFDPAGMVDFTNPEAREWLKGIIKENMIGIGLSGWMADMGEMIPHDCVTFSGEPGTVYHNRYPLDWARLNREAAEEAGKADELLCFYRAGCAGSSAHINSYWNGDQMVDWTIEDGLPSAIMATLTLGMSGAGYIHSDTGGYTTLGYKQRSAELLMRWAEFSAFTQTMRSHEGNRPHRNVQVAENDQVLSHLAEMVKVFTALKPYHRELGQEYQNLGFPPARLPRFHYPDESRALAKYPYQYLYGRDLLVAPVIKPGKTSWKVRLPRDRWIHLWTGRVFEGGETVTIEAPLGRPPVFYRADSSFCSLFEGFSR